MNGILSNFPGGGENVKAEVTAQTPLLTQIQEALVGKAQGANATADKILEGYSAYVGQELIEGTAKDLSKQVAFGIVTPTSDMTSITVEHNLGKNPTYMGIWNPSGIVGYTTPAVFDNWYVYSNTNNSGNAGAAQKCGKSETTATFNAYDSGYPFKSGQSYIWVVIA